MSKTTTTTINLNKTHTERLSRVTLFDCNCHLYEEVIELLMKALKCDLVTALRYADTTQQFGQIDVFTGTKEDCEKVASILGSTGLRVSVTE
jgi:predicted nucleic acid-binding Zn finger protein